ALAKAKAKAARISCVNNLKQVGLGFRMFSNDHSERFPWYIPDANQNPAGDGALAAQSSSLPTSTQNIDDNITIYRSISNEVNSPKVLVCSSDNKTRASTWDIATGFKAGNLSYIVGLDADETRPQTILSGDRNVIGGTAGGTATAKQLSWNNTAFPNPPAQGVASDAGFDISVHKNAGNLGLGD